MTDSTTKPEPPAEQATDDGTREIEAILDANCLREIRQLVDGGDVDPRGVVFSIRTSLAARYRWTGPATPPTEPLLLNLLARIHGDGGHRVIAVGVEQACAEADLMVAKWRACDGCSCICGGTCGCPCHDDEPGIDERRAALQGSKP